MKRLFLSSLLLLRCLLGYGQTLPNPAPVVLQFTYSTNGIVATNSVYRLYQGAGPNVPLTNWVMKATVAGTNFSGVTNGEYVYRITNWMTAGEAYFFVTASNFWLESPPSNVALTPPVHQSNTNLTIERGF